MTKGRTNVSVDMSVKAELDELVFDMRAHSLSEVVRRLVEHYKRTNENGGGKNGENETD